MRMRVILILFASMICSNVGYAEGWWKPNGVLSWDWQLQEPYNVRVNVNVIDLDLFDTSAITVKSLKARNIKVICYINVGAWEDWREDADNFPEEIIGRDYDGWDGEKWLDIRRMDILKPIMIARLDMCKAKGFDGVEPDNIDIFWEDTGFDLSRNDQISYNIWLAEQAHQRGLSIGQKNGADMAKELEPYFDWAMTEGCFSSQWCLDMLPYTRNGKSVFAAEYTDNLKTIDQLCDISKKIGLSLILKNRNLAKWRQSCEL